MLFEGLKGPRNDLSILNVYCIEWLIKYMSINNASNLNVKY